jgi:hypothetical protein
MKVCIMRKKRFENRNGLIVDSRVWEATGTAERYAALEMLQELPGSGRVTVGGDKGFDTADFVRECRNWVTPHVAQNLGRRGGSAIDSRTTRQQGYAHSQIHTPEGFPKRKPNPLFGNNAHQGLHRAGCGRYHADLWKRACQDRRSVDGRRNDSGRPTSAESRETR